MSAKSGRYDRVDEARAPAKGTLLPEGEILPGRVEIAHAAIVDPGETRAFHLRHGKRDRIAVNVASDPLEREFRWGRISEEAYNAGRAYQWAVERAQIGAGARNETGSYHGSGDHDALMARLTDRVKTVVEIDSAIRSTLGAWAGLLLRAVLVDGNSIQQIAERNGRASKAAVASVLAEFREALEGLVEVIDDRA